MIMPRDIVCLLIRMYNIRLRFNCSLFSVSLHQPILKFFDGYFIEIVTFLTLSQDLFMFT